MLSSLGSVREELLTKLNDAKSPTGLNTVESDHSRPWDDSDSKLPETKRPLHPKD